jgi:integrase
VGRKPKGDLEWPLVRPLLKKNDGRFLVDTGKRTAKRIRRVFDSKSGADEYADELRAERNLYGKSVMTETAKAEYHHAKQILGTIKSKLSLVDVANHYISFHVARGRSPNVSGAVEDLLKAKKPLSERYIQQLKFILKDFVSEYGTREPCTITPDELVEFIFRRQDIAETTRHGLYRALAVFFNYCMSARWISDFPLNARHIPTVNDVDPSILTIAEARRLLEATPEDMMVFVALGLFCGIRNQELCRLTSKDIVLSPRDQCYYVVIDRSVSKGNRARNIAIPYNCDQWMGDIVSGRDSDPIIPVKESSIFYRLREIGKAADVKLPQNVIRHSFASYYYETTRDAERTRYRLGHNTPSTLFEHYRSQVFRTADYPFDYFKILPKGKDFGALLYRAGKDASFLAEPTQPALELLRLL